MIYQKLVFTDYRLVFKVQRGTAGAKFVARAIPPADARKAPILVEIKEDWLKDKEWNEFEAVARDSKLTIKVNGKEVYNGAIHVERGFIGWTIAAESAIGLSDIVWHRPR